jgi:hypothetical protein
VARRVVWAHRRNGLEMGMTVVLVV